MKDTVNKRIKGKRTIHFFKLRVDSLDGNLFDMFTRVGQSSVLGAILKRTNKADMTWSSNSTEHDAIITLIKQHRGEDISKMSLRVFITQLKKIGILLPLSSRGTYRINPKYISYGKEEVNYNETEEKLGISEDNLPY